MRNTNVLRCLALGTTLLCACGKGNGPSLSGDEGVVRATFLTSVPDPDVSAIRIDVSAGGAVVQTQTITPSLIVPPGAATQQEGGDAYFVLAAGDYHITATPLDANGKTSSTCTVANAATPATLEE